MNNDRVSFAKKASAEEGLKLAKEISNMKKRGMKVSVDTFKAETQRWCLDNGVDCINDIQGFPYPEIYDEFEKMENVMTTLALTDNKK